MSGIAIITIIMAVLCVVGFGLLIWSLLDEYVFDRERRQRIKTLSREFKIDHGRSGGGVSSGKYEPTKNDAGDTVAYSLMAGGFDDIPTPTHSHVNDHFSGFGSDNDGGHFGGGWGIGFLGHRVKPRHRQQRLLIIRLIRNSINFKAMKVEEQGKELTFEKLADVYEGKMSIWKVHIERCRERDKNAQIMDKETFDRLKSNIEDDAALESLPYGYVGKNPAGNMEFFIISGHHRLRAARQAMITEVIVLADNRITSEDEDAIMSKQLAHNALVGESDKQVLKEIFEDIKDMDAKIKSGIRMADLDGLKFRNVSTDDIKFDFDFKSVRIMFLSSQMTKFEEVVKEIQQDTTVFIAEKDEFALFAETIRTVSKKDDIRAIPSIMTKLCEIALDYYKNRFEESKADTVPMVSVNDAFDIPEKE